MRVASFSLLIGLLLVPGAAAQDAPCPTPEARQFDFWIGEWDVTNEQRSPRWVQYAIDNRQPVFERLEGSFADRAAVLEQAVGSRRETWTLRGDDLVLVRTAETGERVEVVLQRRY